MQYQLYCTQNTSAKYECNINYIALIFSIWKIKGANISFFECNFLSIRGVFYLNSSSDTHIYEEGGNLPKMKLTSRFE